MTDSLNRHLAAVMFTDVAGYTALMQRDEEAALRTRRRHRSALQNSVEGRSGRVMQYFGDGSLSIFSSSFEAVEAAVDIQRELRGDPSLRIGLHSGDIAYDVQGAYGDAVNIAARLEAVCPPGGITISQKIYDDIRRHPQLQVVPSGTVRLKNILDAVPTYAISGDGLVLPDVDDHATSDPSLEGRLSRLLASRVAKVSASHVTTSHLGPTVAWGVPFVGRRREVGQIRRAVEEAEAGRGSTIFLNGPHGVGKSRVSSEAIAFVVDRGWAALRARAHASERLVPFSPFADALMPLVAGLSVEDLAPLIQSGDEGLLAVCPALGRASHSPSSGMSPGDSQARIYWQVAALISQLAADRPLVLVFEDMDFADRASLGLLEFIIQHVRNQRLVILVEHIGSDAGPRGQAIASIEHSTVSGGAAQSLRIDPFDETETLDYVRLGFDLPEDDAKALATVVFEWSQGNPFFVAGTLGGLVDAGSLRQRDGRWWVENLDGVRLPHSVRDAVLVWLSGLSEQALHVARTAAMLAKPASYELLASLSGFEDDVLASSLDELVRSQVLVESESDWTLVYSFLHRAMSETLGSDLPLATRREMHSALAAGLESFYGEAADEHADELAYHFGRAHPALAGPRAIHYLTLAGEKALAVHANREGRQYLQEALDRADAAPPGREPAPETFKRILRGLARARRRLGDTDGTVALVARALSNADAARDPVEIATLHRELGVAQMTGGNMDEAIVSFAAAAEWASGAAEVPLTVSSLIPQALCYQASGQPDEADKVLAQCALLATKLGDERLHGRVARTRFQLDIWTGRIREARTAAMDALRLGNESGDRTTEFRSRWALGALEGLLGNTTQMSEHIEAARVLATAAPSPFFHLAIAELEVELAYAVGDWPRGIARATEAIELARSLGEQLVLPRLLVWVSLIHLGRGDIELADSLTTDAWNVSGAGQLVRPKGFFDLHAVVPAHIGRAAVALAKQDWAEAVRIASLGLEIADRSGYVVWSIHRLLPIIAEASIHARDLARAEKVSRRMRSEAESLGHPLGLAWADACDAILTWLQGDAERGSESLRKGAEAMERIPLRYEEARLRRQLAGRLAETGRTDEARRELQRAFESLDELGAAPEVAQAQGMAKELDFTLRPRGLPN